MHALRFDLFSKDKRSGGDKVAHNRSDITTEISMAKIIKMSHSRGNQVPCGEGKHGLITKKIKIP